jgi:signal transduction histidine kinase
MHRSAAYVIPGIVFGVVSEWVSGTRVPRDVIIADLIVGWAYLAIGTIVRRRVPASNTGVLLVVTCFAWFAGGLHPLFVALHRAVLVHVFVTYPTGRFAGDRARSAVFGVYLASFVLPAVDRVISSGAFGLGLVLFGAAGLMTDRGRRHRGAAFTASLLIGSILLVGAVARIGGSASDPVLLLAYEFSLVAAAVTLGVDSIARRTDGLLARFVVDLGDAGRSGSVRDRLARAVSDPALVVGFEAADGTGRYLDEAGLPVVLPPSSERATVSPMVVGARQTGVIIHDPAVLDDPRLVNLVAAATELALTNSRLQGAARDRLIQVDASRARIVHAGDVQRRRIESDIRSTVAERLTSAGRLLEAALTGRGTDPALATMVDDLERARQQLLDFAGGVHPGLLTRAGLGPAIEDLGRRSDLDVDVQVNVPRMDSTIESTLYFVAAEALANASKHGHASRVRVAVNESPGGTDIEVDDDGSGGAVVREGGGLRGLVDRVEALGGRLTVASSGEGTRVVARIPVTARVESAVNS